jgi:ribosomal protein S18 acetylase RimI-like enzyme/plasmid maintenance system antidote protein VapI
MKQNNIRALDLAAALGISKSLMTDILHYRRRLSREVIRKLAFRFSVSQELLNKSYNLVTAATKPAKSPQPVNQSARPIRQAVQAIIQPNTQPFGTLNWNSLVLTKSSHFAYSEAGPNKNNSPAIINTQKNSMIITPSTNEDIPAIRDLFGAAIEYQKQKFGKHWEGFNEEQVAGEIDKNLHWKITEGEQIAAFFSVAFTDALVWDERDADPAIYLHRIVTNPAFHGRAYVRHITAWAMDYGRAAGKRFVRLDTNRENTRLNVYYQQCGYRFSGFKKFDDVNNPLIPKHYFGPGLSLYEKCIDEP